MTERHKVVPAVLFVLEQDGHYLLHMRRNTGHLDNMWSMPGGHVEAGEHFLQAAVREAQEELGIEVDEDDLELLGIHHIRRNDGLEGLNLYFRILHWKGEPTNTDPAHASDLKWFTPDELPENTNPEFHEVIGKKPAHFALPGDYQPRIGIKLN